MKILKLSSWTAQPHYPYTLLIGHNVETGVALNGIFAPVQVNLPESLYTALIRAGKIKDVKKDMNSTLAEWVKDRWWLYECSFSVGEELDEYADCYLEFGCVDYKCHVYLNNKKVGEHIGATAAFGFNVKKYIKKGDNLLRVVVEHAEDEMGQIGYTNLTHTQRPRFDYKWDFCPRLVNIGIYREVTLTFYNSVRTTGVIFSTENLSPVTANADIYFSCKKEGEYQVSINLSDKGKIVFTKNERIYLYKGENVVKAKIEYAKAKLWNVNGQGNANLYKLSISLYDENILCIATEKTVGFRQIRIEKNDNAPENSLPYTFFVNNKRVYIRGFNVTPFEHLLGDERIEKYEYIIKSAAQANANLIRVWGGGIIEQEQFYQLCSQNGIMVWQDMIQSSSGISNEPPINSPFLELLTQTVDFAITSKGNYPALAVICGGNELFGSDKKPITIEHKNVAHIYEIVKEKASHLIFMPSTSTGPTQEASLENPYLNHDIHGPWLYLGNDRQFSHYNKLQCLFAGEFGCNGMASINSLKKFLSKKNLVVTDMQKNDTWRHHGEVWDAMWWVKELIGEPESLEDYVEVSRFLQKTGLEYAINSHRRRAFYQSGCIIWQLNEMFPNVSSTALIDYYGNKKPAYYAVARAYGKTVVSFKYDKMLYAPNEGNDVEIFIQADTAKAYDVNVKINCNGEIEILSLQVYAEQEAKSIKKISFKMPHKGFVLLEVLAESGKENYKSEALFAVKNAQGKVDKSVIDIIKKKNNEIGTKI